MAGGVFSGWSWVGRSGWWWVEPMSALGFLGEESRLYEHPYGSTDGCRGAGKTQKGTLIVYS